MSAFKFSLEFCILVLDDFAVRGKGELEVTQVDKLAYFSGCTDSQNAFWSLFNLLYLDTFCLSVTTIGWYALCATVFVMVFTRVHSKFNIKSMVADGQCHM